MMKIRLEGTGDQVQSIVMKIRLEGWKVMRCFDLLFVFSLYFSNLPIITNNQLGNLWLTILLYMMIHSDSVQSIRTNANPDKDKAQRYGKQNINKQPYLNSDYVLYIAGK